MDQRKGIKIKLLIDRSESNEQYAPEAEELRIDLMSCEMFTQIRIQYAEILPWRSR